VAAALLLLAAPFATGETGKSVSVTAASLQLDGDSSLHPFSLKAQGVEASVGLDVAAAARTSDLEALIRGHLIKAFQVTVPVEKLTSGERGLDANLRKALKANRYKEIRFRMERYEVLPGAEGTSAPTLLLHGRLSVAGVERSIEVGVAGTRVGDGIRFKGSKSLLMTDYGVKPPTLMLGAIKTADLVTVTFELTLQRK
jgi:polyisoprenoid-binding protein YceI